MKEWKKAQEINWENEVKKSGEREGGERDDRKMEIEGDRGKGEERVGGRNGEEKGRGMREGRVKEEEIDG